MDKRNIFYLFILLALLLFLPGCGLFGGEPPGQEEPVEPDLLLIMHENASKEGHFYRLADMPAAVQDWVDNAAKNLFLGQSRVIDGNPYILVTYGPKPTGGYTVEITDVEITGQAILVDVTFTEPAPGAPVTQAFTYPFDLALVSLDDPDILDLPLVFTAHGAETYMMGLYGLDLLEPIVASSYGIKLFAPADGEAASGALLFRGVASIFEGTVSYRLKDEQGEVLAEGFTTAGMGDWYYFQGEIPLAGLIREEQPALLELFTVSPKDGSEQDKISLKLTVAP